MASTGGDRGGSAAGDDGDQHYCDLFRCFCCWRRSCSPRIPRVVPGRDYMCMPARGGADQRSLCSVLVGCTSAGAPFHNLRLHRFRVAQSGRVIGQSDDLLEPFFGVSPSIISHVDDGETEFDDAMAALGPSGRRLYMMCVHRPVAVVLPTSDLRLPPKVFSLDIADRRLSVVASPPFSRGSYQLVSAHGGLWVPAVLVVESGSGEFSRCLSLYRLVDSRSRSWAEVNSVEFPPEPDHRLDSGCYYGGALLQGYAVIDDRFILLSFNNSSFFCFDCATGTLAHVTTTETDGQENSMRQHGYVPISGKAVHIEGVIYFVRGTKLYAYRYSPLERRPLAPPLEIDTIWPYHEEGYGFVVHLVGHMLCAVWINMNLPCWSGCTTRHVLITTFSIRGITTVDTGCFIPSDVEVLHSTCRRICMLRTEDKPGPECYDIFCFLQEYPDTAPRFDPSVPSDLGVFNDIHQQVEKLPEMLPTCRDYPDMPSVLGGFRDDIPPERVPD